MVGKATLSSPKTFPNVSVTCDPPEGPTVFDDDPIKATQSYIDSIRSMAKKRLREKKQLRCPEFLKLKKALTAFKRANRYLTEKMSRREKSKPNSLSALIFFFLPLASCGGAELASYQ